jgi:hypothetical protein
MVILVVTFRAEERRRGPGRRGGEEERKMK